MDEVELTELTDIEVVRQDAVKYPASGFPTLIMKASSSVATAPSGCGCCADCSMSATAKAVNAVGGIDEKPDIAGAEHILQELGKLVISEASEFVAGAFGESSDLQMLLEAISLMKWFRECEIDGDTDDGAMMKAAGFVFKAHRKFSSDERKSLAAEGKALPDGSYPIPDEDALRRAAILAKSGHGDVAAAKRLIAKRAKELGVPNPLADNDTKKDAPEDVITDTSATETSDGGEDGQLTKAAVEDLIEKATAKVTAEAEERERALKSELDELRKTPIPGQVSLTAPPGARDEAIRNDLLQKAAYFRGQSISDDRETSDYYKGRLAAVEAELARL